MATASVCIVTYNSADDIEACLQAVLAQTHPIEQIVVIDNASTDHSAEVVREFDGKVQLVTNAVNNGFAGGQNQAIGLTHSDYVLVLNPDVVLDWDYLSEIISFMEQQPDVGSATGKLVSASDPSVMDGAGLGMKRNRNAYDLGQGEPEATWGKSVEVFGVSGAAAVYRRAMIDDIEMDEQFFDEVFFAYKEDVDVAWRAQMLGWTAYYVASAHAIHHRGWRKGGRRSVPLFVRRHSYQNHLFTLVKNESFGTHSLITLPLILATEVAKLVYILLRERDLLSSWPFIVRTLPSMLLKRRWMKAKVHLRKI